MFVCMHVGVCVRWGHLDVSGELASHKRSLTHRPSSHGWASRCPYIAIYVCLSRLGLGELLHLSFLSYFLKLVCYAHVFPCM